MLTIAVFFEEINARANADAFASSARRCFAPVSASQTRTLRVRAGQMLRIALKVPSGRWHIRAVQEAIPQKMSQNYIYAATRTKN